MKKHKNKTGIPDCELDSLARILLPAIQKLFEDDQIKNDFKQWQENKRLKEKSISHRSEMLFCALPIWIFEIYDKGNSVT